MQIEGGNDGNFRTDDRAHPSHDLAIGIGCPGSNGGAVERKQDTIDGQRDLMSQASDLFQRDYNAFLHFSVAALYFLTISLTIFFVFGLVYRRLMRHLPQAPRMRFTSRWLGRPIWRH